MDEDSNTVDQSLSLLNQEDIAVTVDNGVLPSIIPQRSRKTLNIKQKERHS